MFRIPLWCSFGVGAAANEPSPRKSVPSSFLTLQGVSGRESSCTADSERLLARGNGTYTWAASLIVKGRTRTACKKIRYCGVGAKRAVEAAGYGPETVIEDAPGSTADMTVGLMFHERLERCLGSHSEVASVRLDLFWV